MNKGLYARLAFTNIRKNGQFYLPYLITGIITVAMFYIMCALNSNPGWNNHIGASDIKMILTLGCIVIAIFAAIFVFYTNSFIIKRRKKELGVYNILGMEKKHLAKVLFLETLFTAFVAVGGGLLTGIVFNKLMCMLLYRLMGYEAGIGFYISEGGVSLTAALFCGIYLLTLLYDMLQIKLSNPIELLHGSNVGEREPKTKILMAAAGVICIGTGYYIAIATENPLKALMMFFVAVLLVILGTYFLFTAGSIALLKLLRKNKNYYYKAKHFTAVSGMLYRMKQNAAGLSNICILSTMVLIMVSVTISMYAGVDDELDTRYPADYGVYAQFSDEVSRTDLNTIGDTVQQTLLESKRSITEESSYLYLPISCIQEGNEFRFPADRSQMSLDTLTYLEIMTRADYETLTDESLPQLKADEAVLVTEADTDTSMDSFTIGGENYTVKEMRTNGFLAEDNLTASYVAGLYCIVVEDSTELAKIYQLQKEAYGDNASSYSYTILIDTDGGREEQTTAAEKLENSIAALDGNWKSLYCEGKEASRESVMQLYGGFFFLGLFLGTMFLIITVLIIFYKQISEGYDDRERFEIMEKVGMSNQEVRTAIRTQIRIVFFLPLVTAAIHVAAAFPMLKRLLMVLNLHNSALFAGCLAGTIVVFAIIYLIVFLLTQKTYYKIVGEQIL